MAEYIEREALIRNLSEDLESCGEADSCHQPIAYGTVLGLRGALSYANTLPTADVVEVRHGEWKDNRNGTFTCSVCGGNSSKMDWCGRCGAKMDGKGDNK